MPEKQPSPRAAKTSTRAAKPKQKPDEQPVKERATYLYAVGRRKTAVARVRLYQQGDGTVEVNRKPLEVYFPTDLLQNIVRQPLVALGVTPGSLTVKVTGGGMHSQAESVRHGIARVLLLAHPDGRPVLKKGGLLTRDARTKERKKYGLKRARRAPQWQKR